MKNVIIIPNSLKQHSVDFAKQAEAFMLEKGYNVQIFKDGEKPLENADFAVVLGGDGTILRSARKLYGMNTVLIGINFGYLGYLAEIGIEDAFYGLKKMINGDYSVEERIMIEGEVLRKDKKVLEFIGLNEASLFRSTLMHALRADVSINKKSTETVFGDGIIVATPTGSTSYNLSAGGPVLTPTSNNIVITPVSPKYFPRSSIVIDANDEIEIKISHETIYETGSACIEIDADIRFPLENGDIINIRKAIHTAKIAKITDKSFYQILREKLSKGSMPQA